VVFNLLFIDRYNMMFTLASIGNILKTAIKLIIGKGVKHSYSQYSEDVLVESFVKNKMNGFYIDVGAFHPVQYSNTYGLYRRGWKGIVIEPNQRAELLFRIFRPRDIFVNVGINHNGNYMQYFSFKDHAYNTMSEIQANEWMEKGVKSASISKVECQTLKEIVLKYKVKRIDVLSIDVEGLDLEVLKSHDWDIPTDIVVVENHLFNFDRMDSDPIYLFMKTHMFELVAYTNPSLIFKKVKNL